MSVNVAQPLIEAYCCHFAPADTQSVRCPTADFAGNRGTRIDPKTAYGKAAGQYSYAGLSSRLSRTCCPFGGAKSFSILARLPGSVAADGSSGTLLWWSSTRSYRYDGTGLAAAVSSVRRVVSVLIRASPSSRVSDAVGIGPRVRPS